MTTEIGINLGNENPIEHLDVHQQYAVNFLYRAQPRNRLRHLAGREHAGLAPRALPFITRPASTPCKPTYVLEWGKSLMSFQPSFATANQPDQVIVRYWNPKTKQKFEGTATRADLAQDGVIDPTADFGVQQGPLSKKTDLVTNLVVQSDDEAKTAGQAAAAHPGPGADRGQGQDGWTARSAFRQQDQDRGAGPLRRALSRHQHDTHHRRWRLHHRIFRAHGNRIPR